MNGADASDAEARRCYLEAFQAFLAWIEEELQGRDDLTEFEKDVYSKACKIQEM